MSQKTVIAIAAHPDDIELRMAGTLLCLKEVGWEIHYCNLSNGHAGSREHAVAMGKLSGEFFSAEGW